MIIKTNLIPTGFDALTFWPFIFIKPNCIHNKGLIKHEMVHYKEQGILVLVWWFRYLVSKKFRLQAEVRAYRVQMKYGGITLHHAATMLTKYKLGIDINKAYDYLNMKEY
jgi:hypothetical protein